MKLVRVICQGTVVAIVSLAAVSSAAPPKLTAFFPPGAARAQKLTVQVTGEFAKWPVEWKSDKPGLTLTSLTDKNKVEVNVAAEAVPGIYWLRVFDGEGASSPRPFVVGTVRDIEEVEPNDAVEKGQELELPVTINGKLGKAGDVDGFVVKLKAGERLIAAVEGNGVLGSPMDAVLQVAQLTGGVEGSPAPAVGQPASPTVSFPRRFEAFVLEQSDDEAGLDPRISFVATREGRYLVRVFAFPSEPNSSIAMSGGDNYVYRLTVTTGGYVDHTLPLARSVAAPANPLTIVDGGPSLGTPPLVAELTSPDAEDESFPAEDRRSTSAFHPSVPGTFVVPWTPHPSVAASDESLTPIGQTVALPVVVSGRLVQARQRATFKFNASKGQAIRLKADARSFGSALDPYIQVRDSMGKVLAEVDDANNQRDALLNFTPPADGVYEAVIRDIHLQGSHRHAYRLTMAPVTPDFALTVAADAFSLTAGKPLEIPVTIDRRDGFAETLDVQVLGLPTGVTQMPAKSEPKGDSAKTVKITLTADPAMLNGVVHSVVRIVGVSTGANALKHRATFTVAGSPSPQHDIWLTVLKP